MDAFITSQYGSSQFGYILVTWMVHNQELNNPINIITEMSYQNQSTFEELLIIIIFLYLKSVFYKSYSIKIYKYKINYLDRL